MFGTFRFMLAMMVVHSHFSGGGLAGPVAVFGFFCLSGYLMTRIVNETYSDGLSGYLRYLGNRAPEYILLIMPHSSTPPEPSSYGRPKSRCRRQIRAPND